MESGLGLPKGLGARNYVLRWLSAKIIFEDRVIRLVSLDYVCQLQQGMPLYYDIVASLPQNNMKSFVGRNPGSSCSCSWEIRPSCLIIQPPWARGNMRGEEGEVADQYVLAACSLIIVFLSQTNNISWKNVIF